MLHKDMFDLSGKVSLVTGGSSGLGQVFCEAMAERGSEVAFSYDSNEVGARQTEKLISSYGIKPLVIKMDLSNPEDIRSIFNTLDRQFAKLDILINNAGMDIRPQKLHELSLDVWTKMIAVNLTGPFLCMQEGIRMMLKQKKGSIINVSSILGLHALDPIIQDSCPYVTCKHGIIGLTKQAAMEYATDGIRVNAIAPGFFPTRISRNSGVSEKRAKDIADNIVKVTPMKRQGDPAEIKGIAVYLASDASSFVTGSVSLVDGGYTIC